MQTQTAERVRPTSAASPATAVAYAGAAAFVIAAAWFWLVTKSVTVTPAPLIGPGLTPEQGMRIYYRWLATTLPQERYYTAIAIAGFLCLAAAAFPVRNLLGRDRTPTTAGALLVGTGALLWITGSVLQLGGHHAIGLMATHTNPIQATNSIAFTIDMIAAAFALAAFALMGARMLGFAAATARQRPRHRGWAGYTTVTATAMLITAGCYAVGNDNLMDLMLLADGVVLLPLWLIWASRIGRTGHPSPNAP